MSDFYILDGTTPVSVPDVLTWARWFETAFRHVAETWVTQTVCVSTVFLGLDYQFHEGPPLLFESMVFEAGEGRDQARYATYHDAEQGHSRMVAQVRASLALTSQEDDRA